MQVGNKKLKYEFDIVEIIHNLKKNHKDKEVINIDDPQSLKISDPSALIIEIQPAELDSV